MSLLEDCQCGNLKEVQQAIESNEDLLQQEDSSVGEGG